MILLRNILTYLIYDKILLFIISIIIEDNNYDIIMNVKRFYLM